MASMISFFSDTPYIVSSVCFWYALHNIICLWQQGCYSLHSHCQANGDLLVSLEYKLSLTLEVPYLWSYTNSTILSQCIQRDLLTAISHQNSKSQIGIRNWLAPLSLYLGKYGMIEMHFCMATPKRGFPKSGFPECCCCPSVYLCNENVHGEGVVWGIACSELVFIGIVLTCLVCGT